MNRIKSGVPGLDSIMGGGLIEGSVNLVTGGTGTGKTIMACQFLWQGLKMGESCVYITLEEGPEDIKEDVANFGWDFPAYEKKGLFKIIYHDPAQVNNLGTVIISELENLKAKRLVIDAISVMELTIDDRSQIRKRILNLINAIKRKNHCTTLLVSEIAAEETKALSRFGVEEFVVDSVILLNYLGIGEEYNRSLMVRKMRRTNHGKDVYPFDITSKGIGVKKGEA